MAKINIALQEENAMIVPRIGEKFEDFADAKAQHKAARKNGYKVG